MTWRMVIVLGVALGGLAPLVRAGVAAPPSAGPDDPQAQLERILQQPMYTRWKLREPGVTNDQSVFGTYVRAIKQMVREFIDWLNHRQDKSANPAPTDASGTSWSMSGFLKGLFWVAVVVAGMFLIYVVIRLARGGRLETGGAKVLTRRQIEQAMASGQALAMPAQRWLDEVGRFTDQQDLRRAFRSLYLALLAGLHERRRIDFHINRTNWTYVRQYHGPADHRRLFGRLTGLFDSIWYGLRQPGEPVLEQAQRHVRQLLGEDGDDA